MYYDIGAYDMKYDEFKQICYKAWSERFNYLCIDMTKDRNDGKKLIFNESKNIYIERICETEAFNIFKLLFPIKDREDLEKLEVAVPLQNQVKAVRLQDKLGKQKFHEGMKKVFKPVTKTLKSSSENITKTFTETSFNNNKAIENLNNNFLEIMSDRGILASYLMSPLSKITNPENTNQFKVLKDSSSNRVIDLLIHNTIPITLYNNMLTFRDIGRKFELKGDLLERITNKNYNVDLAELSEKNLIYDFAKEMNFDLKAIGKKSTRNRTLIKLLKSPGLLVSASSVSKTIYITSDPNKLCNGMKLL